MNNKKSYAFASSLLVIGVTFALIVCGQQTKQSDSSTMQQHIDEMNKRGDQAMGFYSCE